MEPGGSWTFRRGGSGAGAAHPLGHGLRRRLSPGAVGCWPPRGGDVLFGSDGELVPCGRAAAALDGPDRPERLRPGLTRGLSFPAARQAAVERPPGQPKRQPGVRSICGPAPWHGGSGPSPGGGGPRRPAAVGNSFRLKGCGPSGPGRAAAIPYLPAPWQGRRRPWRTHWAVLACLRMMDADWAALPDGGRRGPACPAGAFAGTDSPEVTLYARATKATLTPGCGGWPWLPSGAGCGRRSHFPAAPYVRVLPQRLGWTPAATKETRAFPRWSSLAQARALDGDARAL